MYKLINNAASSVEIRWLQSGATIMIMGLGLRVLENEKLYSRPSSQNSQRKLRKKEKYLNYTKWIPLDF